MEPNLIRFQYILRVYAKSANKIGEAKRWIEELHMAEYWVE